MLIELFGSNFRCFRDEFRLSLEATGIDPDDRRGVVEVAVGGSSQPLRLLRCVAIYGPNAAGKSTVLDAASALWYLIEFTHELSSNTPLIVFEPFALNAGSRQPSMLGARFVFDERVYEYSVTFDGTRFLREALVLVGDGDVNTDAILFQRDGQTLTGAWQQDSRFALVLEGSLRPNASVLGLADRFAPALAGGVVAGLVALLGGLARDPRVRPSGPHRRQRIAQMAKDDTEFAEWLRGHLRAADVGVVDFDIVESITRSTGPPIGGPDAEPGGSPTKTAYGLVLRHRAGDVELSLPFGRESLGTQRVVDLAATLYELTRGPGAQAAFIDEIDTSLHPVLLDRFVRHFNSEMPAASRAQMIFTTHETLLIDGMARSAALRRDQVYFTDKASDGAATLFSLAEFTERNNHNLRKRYLQGRYGALPLVGELLNGTSDA